MSTKVVAARQQASRFRPFVIGLVSGALFVYLAACTFLYSRQDRMVLPTPTKYAKTTPSDAGIPFEDLHIAMNGSEQIHAWWLPASSSSDKVLLAFHGSGYVLEQVFNTNNLELNFLHSLGSNLLFVEYHGYGSSSAGVPSENRVYDDARAAFTYLTVQRKVPSRDIILVGRSLGTAPATEMAKEHPDCAGLILISPFTSISDAARVRYWYLRAMPLSFMNGALSRSPRTGSNFRVRVSS